MRGSTLVDELLIEIRRISWNTNVVFVVLAHLKTKMYANDLRTHAHHTKNTPCGIRTRNRWHCSTEREPLGQVRQ